MVGIKDAGTDNSISASAAKNMYMYIHVYVCSVVCVVQHGIYNLRHYTE